MVINGDYIMGLLMVITQPRFLSIYLFVNLSISPFVYLIISSHLISSPLSPIQFSFKKVKSTVITP